jgi:hypothetical protein
MVSRIFFESWSLVILRLEVSTTPYSKQASKLRPQQRRVNEKAVETGRWVACTNNDVL